MIRAYMEWSLQQGELGLGNEMPPVYDERLIPCAPLAPTVAVSVRALELFRSSSMRCPHLSIQAFVKALCDVQQQPYHSYISKQFSICYDTYLDILHGMDMDVQRALGRADPKWRLKHACIPCTYKLEGEDKLKFSMLVTMDGNDSLKRLIRQEKEDLEGGASGEGQDESAERPDPRKVHEVDKWACESVDMIPQKDSEPPNPNICDDRWKNMASDKTSRMWGIFEETGVFLSLCRHRHVLVVMDMVRSGEQSKYPLAAVNALLDAFGHNLGIGYDIGCKFKTTLRQSQLGSWAEELNAKCLVGSFHGHAHNRICQLQHLATYVEGLGLEDLEGCEPFFSKSNALASSIRHASIFHRRQKINKYIKHLDSRETYLTLSSLIVTSYKRALDLLASEDAFLKQVQHQALDNPDATFPRWLEEEFHYLTSLKREPVQETLKMEYYEMLRKLYKAEARLSEIMQQQWSHLNTTMFDTTPDKTQEIETTRRHAQETHKRALEAIHILEHQLKVEKWWLPGDQDWKEAEGLVAKRQYQCAVDRLESLVVARLFELTKMNMSKTGYKMRQHIVKALKTRSQAIQTALRDFNTAAEALGRETLSWDDVVNYSQLADFDLLSDTCEDVRKRPWASPAGRMLLDRYFKIIRACEEIKRLNIEIRRLTTYIRDEEAFLATKAASLRASHPTVAHQIDLRLATLRRMNDIHIERLSKLLKLPGFTGTLDEGISIENDLEAISITEQSNREAGEEEEQEEEEQEAGDIALKMLQALTD
ncbi:hypothetical protein BJ165DRAFT_1417723 [Panaeolus papilionaceus]|nr:hypothetical protein BJ165DRAFT_1417723 [Panaeolus papilionaceus]